VSDDDAPTRTTDISIAGLCIAAGASTRMGTPKALLFYGNRTAAEIGMENLARGGCDPSVLVVGGDAGTIFAGLGIPVGFPVTLNRRWAAGRTGSIQAGIDAFPDADIDAYVLLPVGPESMPSPTPTSTPTSFCPSTTRSSCRPTWRPS